MAGVAQSLEGHEDLVVLLGLAVVRQVALEDGDDLPDFRLQAALWVVSAGVKYWNYVFWLKCCTTNFRRACLV